MSDIDKLPITEPLFWRGRKKRFAGHPGDWVFEEMKGHPTAFINECRIYELVAAGGTMVDVGANLGATTVVAADFFGRVLAFEPSSVNHELLLHNLALNGVQNATVYKVALSDCAGPADLFLGPDTNGVCHSLTAEVPRQIFGSSRREAVEVRTLDDYCGEAADCTFLQVDVEGNDMRVLHGGRGIIASRKPVIRIEFAPRMWRVAGCDVGQLIQFAQEMGYEMHADFGNNFCPVPPALLTEMFNVWQGSHWGWLDVYLIPRGKFRSIFK